MKLTKFRLSIDILENELLNFWIRKTENVERNFVASSKQRYQMIYKWKYSSNLIQFIFLTISCWASIRKQLKTNPYRWIYNNLQKNT